MLTRRPPPSGLSPRTMHRRLGEAVCGVSTGAEWEEPLWTEQPGHACDQALAYGFGADRGGEAPGSPPRAPSTAWGKETHLEPLVLGGGRTPAVPTGQGGGPVCRGPLLLRKSGPTEGGPHVQHRKPGSGRKAQRAASAPKCPCGPARAEGALPDPGFSSHGFLAGFSAQATGGLLPYW